MKEKIYEIWCEGDPNLNYTACHLGIGKGNTLKRACEDLASKRVSFDNFFNPYNMTYMGCKLFDNYEQARLSHG